MAGFLTVDELDVDGAVVLVRADLNVPIDDGRVTDDFRIVASLPTIAALRRRGAKVVVCSHLGRPPGPDSQYSLAPVGAALAGLGGFEVVVAADVAGEGARSAIAAAETETVVLLENTRFEQGETINDPDLADRLAGLADYFVLDAFGSAHRSHASTVGIAERIRSAAGLLVAAEIDALDRLLHDPDRPYLVVLGGAKVSTKLGVMRALLPKVDALLVGGAMCFTILAAEGYDVGDSRVEEDMLDDVLDVMDGEHGGKVTLPTDVISADRFAEDADHRVISSRDIPDGWIGLDIGPETSARFSAMILGSDTVFWNGPMGVFEWSRFAAGTKSVADAITSMDGYAVVGGGDTVAALRSFGLSDAVSHLSTGGGAGLELLERGTLPGIDVLRRWGDGS